MEYQTLIVGALGFTGVIITLLVNANISRRQRNDERTHESNSIRQALLVELKAVKVTYKDRLSTSNGNNDWLLPEGVTDDIYQMLLPRVGFLTINEIEKVLKAYLLIGELPTRLKLISDSPYDDQQNEGYIRIGKDFIEAAKEMHKNFLIDIEEAINELDKNLDNSLFPITCGSILGKLLRIAQSCKSRIRLRKRFP